MTGFCGKGAILVYVLLSRTIRKVLENAQCLGLPETIDICYCYSHVLSTLLLLL